MWYVFYDWVTAELEKIKFCIQSFSGILHTPFPGTGWKIEHHVHVYSYLKPLIIIWVNVTHITHHYQVGYSVFAWNDEYILVFLCFNWKFRFDVDFGLSTCDHRLRSYHFSPELASFYFPMYLYCFLMS